MTDEEKSRELTRSSFAAQMAMLGYEPNGNPKDMVEVVRCRGGRMKMDYIEKLIEGLTMLADRANDNVCEGLKCCKIAEDARSMLKKQEWHMLTEDDDGIIHGLPGDDGQYLMTDGKDIWIDDYVDGVEDGIILDSGRDIREITAWMYMPELPKKESL